MIKIWLDWLKMNQTQRRLYRREKARAAFVRQIKRVQQQGN
jgi:hypothetical protein